MKHIRNLLSTASILRSVFLTSRETTRPQLLPRRLFHAQLPRRSKFASVEPQAAAVTQTIDEAIGGPSTLVRVVNSEGRLDEPERLRDALESIDRREFYIQQVSPRLQGRLPVCKIINKKAEYLHKRDHRKESQAKKVDTKKIELNWAIDAHDLSHRLKQMAKFLEQGRKVELTLKKKPGKRPPTVEEIDHLMDTTRDAIDAADATQAQPVKGDPGRQMVMTVKKRGT